MTLTVSFHGFLIRICIALSAQVSAAVIGPYICSQIAAAFLPRLCTSGKYQSAACRFFVFIGSHAPVTVYSVFFQLPPFPTGDYFHSASSANISKCLSKEDPVSFRYLPGLWEIPRHHSIKVNEAYDTGFCISGKLLCQFLK